MTTNDTAQPRILLEQGSYEHTETTGEGPYLVELTTTVELCAYYWPKGKPGYTDHAYLEVTDEAGTGIYYEAGEQWDPINLSTQDRAQTHFHQWLELGDGLADIAEREREEAREAYYADRAEEIRMERIHG
jgi:hypothetical protein